MPALTIGRRAAHIFVWWQGPRSRPARRILGVGLLFPFSRNSMSLWPHRPFCLIRTAAFCAATVLATACSTAPRASVVSEQYTPQPVPAEIPVTVQSGGSRMRATMYPAAGEGPHATVLLLHGFPGGPGLRWIAGPVRQAGFNVLLLHPRGMWGSEGEFNLTHALDDVASTVEFLRSERARSELQVDPDRIILVGHSFGGWLALNTAAPRPLVGCVAALTPANLGRLGTRIRADPTYRSAWTASFRRAVEGEAAPIRASESPEEMVAYLMENAEANDVRRVVGLLRDRPVLLLGARDDQVTMMEEHHVPVLEALQGVGASRLTEVVLQTDHDFTHRRDLLTSTLVGWLHHECLVDRSRDPA
jgi:uncharacterized protein